MHGVQRHPPHGCHLDLGDGRIDTEALETASHTYEEGSYELVACTETDSVDRCQAFSVLVQPALDAPGDGGGCGCSNGSFAGGLLAPLALGFARRRRTPSR